MFSLCCFPKSCFFFSPSCFQVSTKFFLKVTRRQQGAHSIRLRNLSQGDYLSLMEDDNSGFKKSSPLLSPTQKPSACIFQLVSLLPKDPWANCCIFINQLNVMRWKDLFKRMEKGETETEHYSNSFPWKSHFLPWCFGEATFSCFQVIHLASLSNFHTLTDFL